MSEPSHEKVIFLLEFSTQKLAFKLEKKSINVALVETTRIMHRTREEPQTHEGRARKKRYKLIWEGIVSPCMEQSVI